MRFLSPLLADADLGQIVFVIVALAAGFIQWLIKMMKEKSEAAGRSGRMPTKEESDARYRAWEEQTRAATPPPPPRTETPRETFGELMAEVREAMAQYPPRTPPPLPQPAPYASRPLAASPLKAPTLRPPEDAPAMASPISVPARLAPISSTTMGVLESLGTRREPHPYTRMLRTPDGYRQAFVMREVLGPPRALREYAGPED